MSALGHSRPGPAGRRSSHVRYAPKATFGHQNAIGREWDGPAALPPPQRLSEYAGGLSGEGAPPCLARPPFTQ
jgi:hypothetical protein